MTKIILVLSILFHHVAFSKVKTTVIKINYFRNIFGHVHKSPSKYSTYLTTIECGHPIKILKKHDLTNKKTKVFFNKTWNYVQVGSYKGFINSRNLTNKKTPCFQDKYPRFFDDLNLEIDEMYYWGKLYDQYLIEKSRAR